MDRANDSTPKNGDLSRTAQSADNRAAGIPTLLADRIRRMAALLIALFPGGKENYPTDYRSCIDGYFCGGENFLGPIEGPIFNYLAAGDTPPGPALSNLRRRLRFARRGSRIEADSES